MAVLAQTPVVAEATPVGALSAQRRSCWLEERWVAVDRGCVKTSSRFHTSLFRSLLRGLRAFRVQKNREKSCSARSFTKCRRVFTRPRPFVALQDRPYQRARSARKRSLAEGELRQLRSSSDALPTLVAHSKPLGQLVARVDVKVARGDRGAQVRQHSIRWSVRKSRPRLAFALALALRTA
jgi:hypothetical protein